MSPFPYLFPFDFETEDLSVRIAFDSAPFDDSPRWTDVSADVFSGTVKVGRQHELGRIETGTCSLLIDNDSGNYWPDNASGPHYGKLLPGKRINIRKTYGGTEYDVFTGFVESFRPKFLSRDGMRPVIEITGVDLFKTLALTELNELVADFDGADWLSVADHADLSMGGTSMTLACWVWMDNISALHGILGKYDNANTDAEYWLRYELSVDEFGFGVTPNGVHTSQVNVYTPSGLSANRWYHVIAYYDNANGQLGIAIDGGTPQTTAYGSGIYNGTSNLTIGRITDLTGFGPYYLDGRIACVGIWKKVLSAAERSELYSQGRKIYYADLSSGLKTSLQAWWDLNEESGDRSDSHTGGHDLTDNSSVASISQYPSELSNIRIGRVLDNVGWPSAKRDLDTGAATLQALNPVDGVNALSHLQSLQETENGIIFIQGDGDVEFQNRTARASSPFDTSQATFGDDAGELPYQDIEFSYDDSFIYNEVRLTRTGGVEVTAGDLNSQESYGKRTLSKTGLLNNTDADVLTVAEALRDKRKDPALRAEYITVDVGGDPANLWPKVLGYGISTRITVRLNEASLDSEFHIEGIEHTFGGKTWVTKWQLSKAS